MKRIFCILTAALLLSFSSSYADQHMDIQCMLAGEAEGEGNILTVDLYEQEVTIYALSSLIPDNALQIRQDAGFSLREITALLSLRPSQAAEIWRAADATFMQWLEQSLSEPTEGVYAGELFDHASTSREADLRIDDLILLAESFSVSGYTGDPDGADSAILSMPLSGLLEPLKGSGLTVSILSFDGGTYLSAQILDRKDVIMTVSADRSRKNGFRILTSYREDGRYCFRDIEVSFDTSSVSVLSSFRTGDDTAAFSEYCNQTLFSESFVMNETADRSSGFEWTIESSSALGDPLIITGTITAESEDMILLAASAVIGGQEREVFRISASAEPLARPAVLTDKTVVPADDSNGNTGIMMTAYANLMTLAARMIPVLPEQYQNMVMNLFR